MRLDVCLFERGLAKSRSFAKALVDEGYVTVDGRTVKKASYDVTEENEIVVTGVPYEYVSRGGVKLSAALDSFNISVENAVCADIGASTGGFTDCLLRRGAAQVYAVDSGSGQLAKEIAQDKRVVNIENFNARYLTHESLGCLCDVAVMDVSFISQTLILPAVKNVLKDSGVLVSLIKPQFECGKEGPGKGGIVRDKSIAHNAVMRVISSARENFLGCVGLIKSPVTGGDGNTEFLMVCRPHAENTVTSEYVKKICFG